MHTVGSTIFSSQARQEMLGAPRRYLSSAQTGWTGLAAEAFHEPREIESWVVPAQSDVRLILFAGGAMHLEQRHEDGPWTGFDLGHEGLILRPGMDRGYEVRWTSLTPTPTQTLHLHVGTDLLIRTAEEVSDHDPACLCLFERLGFQDRLLAQIGFSLWRELEHPAPAGRMYAETAALMLAVHLLRHYTSAAGYIRTPGRGLTHRQVTRVTDFIEAHLSDDLSLDVPAQQVGFSPYHFARMFRQTMGESPHQYVLRQRLERAQRLLQEPVPLARIARATGFADQSHFTRNFKRRFGVTPRAHRQGWSMSARLG